MKFDLSGDQYDRFMGRYSRTLAPLFADFAGVESGQRVLDVGCGTGMLSAELAHRTGVERVSAIDPSAELLAACRARLPGMDVQSGSGEELPWADAEFDVALAQLVVSFTSDGPRMAREMRRVVRPSSGIFAACMWAAGPAMQLTDVFWQAASMFGSSAPQRDLALRYRTPEELRELWQGAGALSVRIEALDVQTTYLDFEDFWTPLLTAAGPLGAYMATLDEPQRIALREAARQVLGSPSGSFTLSARAWAVRGMRP